jgi:hypothetical protein
MDIKELNEKIKLLATANADVEATIQELGLACLGHLSHGNNGPIVSLLGALRRTQYRAFTEWALAFGMCSKNVDKKTKEVMPLVYDKSKTTDIEGATAKPWFMFAEDKAAAVAKAFDFQQAVMSLLKKAAAAGHDHSQLVQVASIAGIKPEKVPATVMTAEQAAEAQGAAIV